MLQDLLDQRYEPGTVCPPVVALAHQRARRAVGDAREDRAHEVDGGFGVRAVRERAGVNQLLVTWVAPGWIRQGGDAVLQHQNAGRTRDASVGCSLRLGRNDSGAEARGGGGQEAPILPLSGAGAPAPEQPPAPTGSQ